MKVRFKFQDILPDHMQQVTSPAETSLTKQYAFVRVIQEEMVNTSLER